MSEDEKWLDLTIPKIAKNLNLCAKDTHYVLDKTLKRDFSNIYFAHISYTNEKCQQETQFLVIKRYMGSNIYQLRSQFHNEMLFYQMIHDSGENFPKCYYCYVPSPNSPDHLTIVLEDISKKGFEPCPVFYNPSYNYILEAVRALGQFHAKWYVLKEKNPAKFYHIVDNIQKVRYDDGNKEIFGKFLNITSTRAVEYLYKHGYDVDLCKKMEALFSNAFEKVMQRIIAMTESSSKSLSTICHGDPTLGNILFQRQSNGDFNAMLIDFGLLTYGTPVIDLSTLLCLSCTNNMIRDKLHDILRAYHLALTKRMSLEGVADTQKYSFDAILNNYKKGCLFGFVIASFFLARILDNNFLSVIITEQNLEKRAQIYKKSGGDEVSAKLAEMLLQMVDLGCLEFFS